MKHEAFVDAMSMLDDDIIAEAQEPFRRNSHGKLIAFCSAAAACAAVIGTLLLLPGGKGAEILVMGRDISANAVAVGDGSADGADEPEIRAFSLEPTDIPVSIAPCGTAVVTVSGGELYSGDPAVPAETPLELSENASLIWSVPLWDSSLEFTLTVQTGNDSRILLLSYDGLSQEWTVKESSQ